MTTKRRKVAVDGNEAGRERRLFGKLFGYSFAKSCASMATGHEQGGGGHFLAAILGCSPGRVSWAALLGSSPWSLSWVDLLGGSPGLLSWVDLLGGSPGLLSWVELLGGSPGLLCSVAPL
jgi:hypothetical protein